MYAYGSAYPPPSASGSSVRYMPSPSSTIRRKPTAAVEEFPGPLHIPPQSRLPPSHSPSSSSYSSDSLRSPSPPLTSWRDRGDMPRHEKLPPIHHLTSAVDHLASAGDWHREHAIYCPPPFQLSPRNGIDSKSHRHDQPGNGPSTYSMPQYHSFAKPSSVTPGSTDETLLSLEKSKFGIRRGARFYCTYISPLTGKRCATWDQGWTVYATLNRHAESDHAHEELELINQGRLTYSQAQIVTSREKQQRIQEHLATTAQCPDCGTVFSSNRKDSLARHKQTSACEKAQKRGRPPTKFPKKPKGQGYQFMDADSGEE